VTHDPKTAVHTQRTINLVDGQVDTITHNGKHRIETAEVPYEAN
jgi:ABC-type lipoprotein export system ATPase subunit